MGRNCVVVEMVGEHVVMLRTQGQSFAVMLEDFFDGEFEQPRHFESQWQARIIFLRLDGVDGLPRNTEFVRQVRLRPFFWPPAILEGDFSLIAAVENAVAEEVAERHQQKYVAGCADVPTGVGRFAHRENGLKDTGLLQAMPQRDKEKSGAHREKYRRQSYATVQFVHATDPSRQAPRPEQNGKEWNQCHERPHRGVPLNFLTRLGARSEMEVTSMALGPRSDARAGTESESRHPAGLTNEATYRQSREKRQTRR
jgi:hypothetical protein